MLRCTGGEVIPGAPPLCAHDERGRRFRAGVRDAGVPVGTQIDAGAGRLGSAKVALGEGGWGGGAELLLTLS